MTVGGSSVRLLSMAASPARLSACSLPWTPALPVLKIRESFKAAVCNERDLIKIESFFFANLLQGAHGVSYNDSSCIMMGLEIAQGLLGQCIPGTKPNLTPR